MYSKIFPRETGGQVVISSILWTTRICLASFSFKSTSFKSDNFASMFYFVPLLIRELEDSSRGHKMFEAVVQGISWFWKNESGSSMKIRIRHESPKPNLLPTENGCENPKISYYLWWIGPALKHCKVSNYYDQDCCSVE